MKKQLSELLASGKKHGLAHPQRTHLADLVAEGFSVDAALQVRHTLRLIPEDKLASPELVTALAAWLEAGADGKPKGWDMFTTGATPAPTPARPQLSDSMKSANLGRGPTLGHAYDGGADTSAIRTAHPGRSFRVIGYSDQGGRTTTEGDMVRVLCAFADGEVKSLWALKTAPNPTAQDSTAPTAPPSAPPPPPPPAPPVELTSLLPGIRRRSVHTIRSLAALTRLDEATIQARLGTIRSKTTLNGETVEVLADGGKFHIN